MGRLLPVLLALALLAGCGDDGGDDAPRRAQRTPSATPTPAATPEPVPHERIHFRATDGERVAAEFTPAGRRAPAVVLIHQVDGGADQWDAFVPALHEAGYATIAYDGRGGFDERALVKEADGAVAYLRGRRDVDPRRIAIVGASIGANTAALALARDARRHVRGAVALSPADSPFIDALQQAGRYHPRGLLVIADGQEIRSGRRFARGAVASRALESRSSGHGVALLAFEDDRRSVLEWLAARTERPG
jgi:acetyl esterase/lipase